MWNCFTGWVKLWADGGAKGKDCRSFESLGFILWRSWMKVYERVYWHGALRKPVSPFLFTKRCSRRWNCCQKGIVQSVEGYKSTYTAVCAGLCCVAVKPFKSTSRRVCLHIEHQIVPVDQHGDLVVHLLQVSGAPQSLFCRSRIQTLVTGSSWHPWTAAMVLQVLVTAVVPLPWEDSGLLGVLGDRSVLWVQLLQQRQLVHLFNLSLQKLLLEQSTVISSCFSNVKILIQDLLLHLFLNT